jgi:coenzyme F420 hydrogenase subunit beta
VTTDALLDQVAAVVAEGNCSGCGACVLLDPRLRMRVDGGGHSRPVADRAAPAAPVPRAAELFPVVCPGRRMTAQRPAGSVRNALLGPVVQAWEAWATDPAIRHRGSSGGALTALSGWLAETGEVTQVVAAAAAPADPTVTVPIALMDRESALAAAGSRYAPVSNAAHPRALDAAGAVVGKPCEASALRSLAVAQGVPAPLLLSFFCAGVPTQQATSDLVQHLGLAADEPLTHLRYRGQGWPGRFTAVSADGREVSASYDESWGQHLGRTTQWRCKICPDGVGESADIAAGDLWRVDERGYPVFAESDGMSVLIARTLRGQDVVQRAVAAGVLRVQPVDLAAVVAAQPLQVSRRTTLFARLLGARAAGRPVPRYRGFGLLALAVREPRTALRAGRGTFRRSVEWRRSLSVRRRAVSPEEAPGRTGAEQPQG